MSKNSTELWQIYSCGLDGVVCLCGGLTKHLAEEVLRSYYPEYRNIKVQWDHRPDYERYAGTICYDGWVSNA